VDAGRLLGRCLFVAHLFFLSRRSISYSEHMLVFAPVQVMKQFFAQLQPPL
jgi:hypothetical protein